MSETEGKSIWDLYVENFLKPLWEEIERDVFSDEECATNDDSDGYEVDPDLLKGL